MSERESRGRMRPLLEPPKTISPPSIVTAQEPPGPSCGIVPLQDDPAATGATYGRILFAWSPKVLAFTVPQKVVGIAPDKLKVFRAVVVPVAVPMMNHFTFPECATKQVRDNKTVFIDVATAVCERMARRSNKHIPVLSDSATATPQGMLCTFTEALHGGIIQQAGCY